MVSLTFCQLLGVCKAEFVAHFLTDINGPECHSVDHWSEDGATTCLINTDFYGQVLEIVLLDRRYRTIVVLYHVCFLFKKFNIS